MHFPTLPTSWPELYFQISANSSLLRFVVLGKSLKLFKVQFSHVELINHLSCGVVVGIKEDSICKNSHHSIATCKLKKYYYHPQHHHYSLSKLSLIPKIKWVSHVMDFHGTAFFSSKYVMWLIIYSFCQSLPLDYKLKKAGVWLAP